MIESLTKQTNTGDTILNASSIALYRVLERNQHKDTRECLKKHNITPQTS